MEHLPTSKPQPSPCIDTLFDVFGEENIRYLIAQVDIHGQHDKAVDEMRILREKADHVFDINFNWPDIAVAVAAGVLVGIGNAIFKDFLRIKEMSGGNLEAHLSKKSGHSHNFKGTVIDHQHPSPGGGMGSTDLHRQIGPTHDVYRFKETIEMLKSENPDYQLWGKKASEWFPDGGIHSVGVKVKDFLDKGGFAKLGDGDDPRAILINHLIIDFFTKMSLPVPGTTYLAGKSNELAQILCGMYRKGFNFKNLAGNAIGVTIIELVIRGYTLLYRAIPESGFSVSDLSMKSLGELYTCYDRHTQSNEFRFMGVISHLSSFTVDTLITCGSKQYAGIFQLNYISLIALSKHLVAYLLKNYREYSALIGLARDKADEIGKLNEQWLRSFDVAFRRNFNSPEFQSILDADSWMYGTAVIDRFYQRANDNIATQRSILLQMENIKL